MSYDPLEERDRIYELLSVSKIEDNHLAKKELFDESITFALSEYQELAISYDNFFKSINHLVIFNHAIKGKVMKETINMLRELKFLIEKNYEKEELEKMPTAVYDQVLHTQKQRADLLKQVAETYLKQRVKR